MSLKTISSFYAKDTRQRCPPRPCATGSHLFTLLLCKQLLYNTSYRYLNHFFYAQPLRWIEWQPPGWSSSSARESRRKLPCGICESWTTRHSLSATIHPCLCVDGALLIVPAEGNECSSSPLNCPTCFLWPHTWRCTGRRPFTELLGPVLDTGSPTLAPVISWPRQNKP